MSYASAATMAPIVPDRQGRVKPQVGSLYRVRHILEVGATRSYPPRRDERSVSKPAAQPCHEPTWLRDSSNDRDRHGLLATLCRYASSRASPPSCSTGHVRLRRFSSSGQRVGGTCPDWTKASYRQPAGRVHLLRPAVADSRR